MKRITPELKAIADAHIEARKNNSFYDPYVETAKEVFAQLKEGKTFSALMEDIEIRFVSVTSNIYARMLDHYSESYKKGIYKGFKTLYSNYYGQ